MTDPMPCLGYTQDPFTQELMDLAESLPPVGSNKPMRFYHTKDWGEILNDGYGGKR